MLNEDRAGAVADLLASLERWQRRAERFEETAEHERELREAMEGFVRAGVAAAAGAATGSAVGAGPGGEAGTTDAAIVSALARAARVVRADRTYALIWSDPTARVYVWPPSGPAAAGQDLAQVSIPGPRAPAGSAHRPARGARSIPDPQEAAPAFCGIDALGLVSGLAAGFVERALSEIREGRPVEWPPAAGATGLGSPGDGASALRSLLWVPIGVAPLVKGLLGCDASTVELYWSPPRRVFMSGLAAMLDLVAAPPSSPDRPR